MQTITCPNCGERYDAAQYTSCPFCHASSPAPRRSGNRGGKRLATGRPKTVAPQSQPEPRRSRPEPESYPASPEPAPRQAAPEQMLETSAGAPPVRKSFWSRFFFFCSIILIIAAICIVLSIVKTLFGDKGTPAPAESAITEVSPSVLTGLILSDSEITLAEASGTHQLTVSPQPDTASLEAITWSSDTPAVATVDETGLITAVSKGTATITVTSGDYSAACTVYIGTTPSASPAPSAEATEAAGNVTLSREDFTLAAAGDSYTIQVSGASGDVTWSSEDESVATVSSTGKVTAVAKGKTLVKAEVDGQTLECIVRVK